MSVTYIHFVWDEKRTSRISESIESHSKKHDLSSLMKMPV